MQSESAAFLMMGCAQNVPALFATSHLWQFIDDAEAKLRETFQQKDNSLRQRAARLASVRASEIGTAALTMLWGMRGGIRTSAAAAVPVAEVGKRSRHGGTAFSHDANS